MWQRFREWWRATGDLAQLQGVSDRMLEDMGLDRTGLRARVLGKTPQAPAKGNSAVGSPAALALSCRC